MRKSGLVVSNNERRRNEGDRGGKKETEGRGGSEKDGGAGGGDGGLGSMLELPESWCGVFAPKESDFFDNLPFTNSFLQSKQGVRLVCVPEETVPPDGRGVAEAEGGDDGDDAAVRKGWREAEDDG